MTSPTWIRLALLGVLAAGVSACGIPTSDQAVVVSRHTVPYHLLSPTIPTTTTTSEPAVAFVTEPIYLIASSGKLASVKRNIAVPASLPLVIEALLDGPTTTESSIGVTSALPSGIKVLSTEVNQGVAVLNLTAPFGSIGGAAETQAVAQLVLTATSQPGVSSVSFEIANTPINVPTASGVTTKGPVTGADYASMVGPAG